MIITTLEVKNFCWRFFLVSHTKSLAVDITGKFLV